MKGKEGFTLIELLAVIVLLSIILVIATTQVGKAIKHNKAKSFNNSAVAIVESAKSYLKSNNKPGINYLKTTLNTLNKYDTDTMKLSIKDAKKGNIKVGYMIALTYEKDDITLSDLEDEIRINGFGYVKENNKIKICAYVDYEGKFWATVNNSCDSGYSPIKPIVNTTLPEIGGGDTPIITVQ